MSNETIDDLNKLRHSATHVMAQAVQELFPGTKIAIGPVSYTHLVVSVSSFHTVGILYADLVGYLCARVDTISKDSELFENIPPDQWDSNGKIRKWKSSTKLLESIKKFDQYEVSVK